jgi:hypothetical protein
MDLSKIEVYEPPAALRVVTQAYAALLLIAFALIPAQAIAYLYFFQDPTLKFEDHLFHEVAIAVATLEGLFITYVTWRCYQSSGEPLLRWLTLGFLGFVLIYALHGAFTGMAHHNIWLFLLLDRRRAWRCRFCSSSGCSPTGSCPTTSRHGRIRPYG